MKLPGRQLALAGFAIVSLVAAACGTEPAPTPAPAATAVASPTAPSPAATPTALPAATAVPTAAARPTSVPAATPTPSAVPVMIEHKFGTITVPGEPRRVVTIGFSEQDPVLALGVRPVAVREWFGGHPHAVWPWALDELGDAEPEVLTMPFGELDFERIAALEPDLIIATHSGITEDEYKLLSRIAPTLAQSGDYPDFGMPWQEQTRSIGRALGLEDRAEEIVSRVEAKIASAGGRYAEFQGATVAWASPTGDGQYWAVGPTTPPMRFLASLGLRVPADLAEVIGDKDSAQISQEQLNLLDVDVLIFQGISEEGVAALEGDPLYRQLGVAREGRTVFFSSTDDPVYAALSFSTVLSLSYAVDELAPLLSAAIDGDPATAATGTGSAAYPVTIVHKYGETTIAEFPQRVVSIGYNEHDSFLALGVVPVALRYWFGDEPFAVFPWAQDELGDTRPEVLNMPYGELDFEQIAALRPDMISAVYSGITEDEYNTLSRIAPTVAQPGEYIDFGTPWQEQTRIIGRVLGRAELADRLVSAVEAQFEAVQLRNPEWVGMSVVVGAPRGDGQFGFVASEDARSRVFTSMGFEVPAELDAIAGDSFWASISLEQANLLDGDLLVIHQMQWVEGGRDAVTADPILSRLDAVREGRVLFVEGSQDDALQFGTVLSLSYFLGEMESRVALAMDGDPSTDANP